MLTKNSIFIITYHLLASTKADAIWFMSNERLLIQINTLIRKQHNRG
jgi:hypothetical protein